MAYELETIVDILFAFNKADRGKFLLSLNNLYFLIFNN